MGIFGFGFPQWLKIRISLFPKGEELLVVVKRGGGVACYLLRASHLQARESANDVSPYYTRMIDQLLELCCGLLPLMELKISQTSWIGRIHIIDALWNREFIVQGWPKADSSPYVPFFT